jgi:hypothetical protein
VTPAHVGVREDMPAPDHGGGNRIEAGYDPIRHHWTLDYISPLDYQRAHARPATGVGRLAFRHGRAMSWALLYGLIR